ncbi:hypothetical protein NLG97_g6471 [Lecanicillium saksenae]|uniref:Uncharacterized protein n=1 Tax=Lecanicillium saksenae TaxID=468837 RepID=A0ACC1QRV0_9HYPO|nr:hypothetical protein NLG97_g6471 [Lecanicillium saksenae]
MAGKAIHAGEKTKQASKDEFENTKDEIVGGMQKMSGRGTEGQKGFRSEMNAIAISRQVLYSSVRPQIHPSVGLAQRRRWMSQTADRRRGANGGKRLCEDADADEAPLLLGGFAILGFALLVDPDSARIFLRGGGGARNVKPQDQVVGQRAREKLQDRDTDSPSDSRSE